MPHHFYNASPAHSLLANCTSSSLNSMLHHSSFGLLLQSLMLSSASNVFFFQSILLIVARIIFPKYKSHHVITLIKHCKGFPIHRERAYFPYLKFKVYHNLTPTLLQVHLFRDLLTARISTSRTPATLSTHLPLRLVFSSLSAWSALYRQTPKSTQIFPMVQG